MPHVLEPAATARSKCRACGASIAAGELRFGERLPNPFAEGETTHWFHPDCAAFMRPEAFLQFTDTNDSAFPDRQRLEGEARQGVAHRRLPRVNGAERAPSGRARCRACHDPIEAGAWRIRLVFYEEGRFQPSGFIHPRCARGYLETTDLAPRLRRFSPDLGEDGLQAITGEMAAGA